MNTLKKTAIAGAMLVATMGGGAIGAALLGGTAGAASNPLAATATTAPAGAPAGASAGAPAGGPAGRPDGPHSANGITETPLAGDTLAQATAAAKAAVPGATVERAETDAEGAKYEVHMTKTDGSEVTVKLDASFKVTDTISGRG